MKDLVDGRGLRRESGALLQTLLRAGKTRHRELQQQAWLKRMRVTVGNYSRGPKEALEPELASADWHQATGSLWLAQRLGSLLALPIPMPWAPSTLSRALVGAADAPSRA